MKNHTAIPQKPVYIIMGVAGSGKTTVGRALAAALQLPFYDADDFHPPDNVEKMRSGKSLTDMDRRPWLETLAWKVHEWGERGGAVLACSALKESYRTILKSQFHDVQFIYLKGSYALLRERMLGRKNHFMPPDLLDSQFEALEEPADALVMDAAQDIEKMVRIILEGVKK